MFMRINYNASAVIATNSLNKNDNRLQAAMERLSTGFKVNNAKDNPSGLAMARRMNAQIEGIDQATQNSGDGVSIIEIADGTLAEIHDMLQRINELAVKASTGTVTGEDRELIDQEVQELKEEIERIASEAEFNGQKLMDGSFDLRGYTDNDNVKVTYYSDSIISGEYAIDMTATFKEDGTVDEVTGVSVKRDILDADGNPVPDKNNPVLDENDVPVLDADGNPVYHPLTEPVKEIEVKQVDGNIVTITGESGFELKLRVSGSADTPSVFEGVKAKLTGFGSMDMQIGANEGQQLDIIIPKVSLENMGISKVDMKTDENARDGLDKVKGAIKYVSNVRSGLGAYQNRLEHTISSLDITNEGMTAAYSRIMDTDMAEEMTEYTTMQVIAQASTSMLAQANERPSQVLQLLQ